MKNNNRKSAFSLIEISIVIIIIGILVAGVTQSSRLLSQAKISSAKSMTQSSPVASITGLSLWVDSVSDGSFQSDELDDGATITTWNDINPQTITKANLTTSGDPVYKTNIINGLPAVFFDGTDDFASTANFSNLSREATIFVVIKTPSAILSTPTAIFSKRISAGDTGTNIQVNLGTTTAGEGWELCDSVSSSGAQNCYKSGTSIAVNSNYVMQMIYTAGSSTGVDFFQNGNGGTQRNSSSNSPASVPDSLFVGKSGLAGTPAYFGGHIAELIIFDRVLKLADRRAIEAYLGKKWGIVVAQ